MYYSEDLAILATWYFSPLVSRKNIDDGIGIKGNVVLQIMEFGKISHSTKNLQEYATNVHHFIEVIEKKYEKLQERYNFVFFSLLEKDKKTLINKIK